MRKRLSSDYEGRCGQCHKLMSSEDNFCRYCGTPRGGGDFKPYENSNVCVYGPPIATTHTCTRCGLSWTVNTLGSDDAQFCPKCGGGITSKYKERW